MSRDANKKITIVFINLYTEMGGGEIALFHLLKELDTSRFLPVMVFHRRGPFVEKVESLGVMTAIVPFKVVMLRELIRPGVFMETLRSGRALHRIVQEVRADVIHCSDVLSLILLARSVRRERLPVVYSVIFFYEWTRRIAFNILALVFVKKILANSNAVAQDLQRRSFFLRERTSVVHPGVDMDQFRPAVVGEANLLRKQYSIPEDVAIIGMLARFEPAKGHIVLLRAASRLIRDGRKVQFVIVGGVMIDDVIPTLREYQALVMSTARELGVEQHVTFLPHQDNVADIIRGFDLLAVPSISEAFGLVVLEALASGIPVVVSKTVGAMEVVGDTPGVFAVEPGDASSLERGINAALEYVHSKSAVNPRVAYPISRKFTWKNYASGATEIYASLTRDVQ